MASGIYNVWKKKQLEGGSTRIDFLNDTIKVALVTSSYTPDFDAHDFFDDITNEVAGTGYSAGGATLGSKTVTQDDTDNEGVFDAADTSWASSTITARGAVIYKDSGAAGTSPLIAYIDFGGNISSTGGTFLITWNSEGIINLG